LNRSQCSDVYDFRTSLCLDVYGYVQMPMVSLFR
jgi:hypothetical protein